MERAAGTGQADLEALYREHETALLRLAFVLVGTRGDAEDLVQTAFLALANAGSSVEHPAAYLRGVVVRRAQDQHRRGFRRMPARPDSIVGEPEVDETWTLVQRLPAAQRAVVVLRFYEDLSLVDIAQLTGRPEGTVRSDLHRALTRLRGALATAGGSSDG